MARWCTTCATEREGKFCQDCGAPLVDKMKACSCGYVLPDDAKFCPECGSPTIIDAHPKVELTEPAFNPLICLHCNSEQDNEKWRFCVVCGEKRPEPHDEAKPIIQEPEETADKPTQTTARVSVQSEQANNRIAACNNNAEELYRLGKQFIDENNEIFACECFRIAAALGHTDSHINFIFLNEQCDTTVNNESSYTEHFDNMDLSDLEHTARNSSDPTIHTLLGIRFLTENEDVANAIPWLRLGAEKGNDSLAQAYLSRIFVEHFPLEGFPFERILEYGKKGNLDVHFNLAMCYELGIGTSISKTDAQRWYTEPAKQGDVDAQLRYAITSELSNSISKEFLRKSRAQGSIEALVLYSFSKFLNKINFSWDGNFGDLYIRNVNMSTEKLNNVINSYGKGIFAERVLVLWDDTFLGSATDGFIITDDMFIISSNNKYYGHILKENFNTLMKNHNITRGEIKSAINWIIKYYKQIHS